MIPLDSLSLLPVAPWPVLVLLAAVAALLVWWPAGRRERAESRTTRVRRSAMVAVLLVAALRPALPGTDVRVDASALDVYLVVDTTTSVMARDYRAGEPRLVGVRADVKGIANQLSGAHFSLITFDVDTTTRLPLTSDTLAVAAAADTLRAETSVWSRGTSVTLARDALRTALDRGRASHPERARLVFYLGDGEQTSAQRPEPFDVAGLVNGGAVLGYGTAAGGPMASTGTPEQGDILDQSTGKPGRSVIDEQELGAIASQLGVPYLHRTADDNAASVVDAVSLKGTAALQSSDTGTSVGGRAELYWVALLALVALAAWELGALLAQALPGRRRRSPRRGRRPRESVVLGARP